MSPDRRQHHQDSPPPLPTSILPQVVDVGREMCGDVWLAERREWLVTNGIGGFASGTVAGSLTRRYHGLLIAALTPPLGRTLLVSKLEETVKYREQTVQLSTNHWDGGTIAPTGFLYLERFRLEGTTPVWTFAIADAQLEKRIWMEPGENTTYVQYSFTRGSLPIRLSLRAFINHRDYHGTTLNTLPEFFTTPIPHGLQILPSEGSPFFLSASDGSVEAVNTWYHNYDLPLERERGLPDREHHLHIGTWNLDLKPGEEIVWMAGTRLKPSGPATSHFESRRRHEVAVLQSDRTAKHSPLQWPDWIQQLTLAADQFIVSRPLPPHDTGHTIIAGYQWFGDWGRDTMISLPGLTLTTQRFDVARSILSTFAQYTNQGMLPNRFPDAGEEPEYNTVDATLWYVEAVRQYVDATDDRAFLKTIFPVLVEMLGWYRKGTRFGIGMDPADHLLHAGEPGVQLTWMDAKIGDWVVTPRVGKPVEINALWYQAWLTLGQLARTLTEPHEEFLHTAKAIHTSFQRFWDEPLHRCYDVLDGPHGHDPAPRPNQLFAVSLPNSPLTYKQQHAVVDYCAQHLYTSYGLRSLGQEDPQFEGQYAGDIRQRDGAYHQGTVWGWLLGPFVLAHHRVYRHPEAALSYLNPMAHHLNDYGLGTLGEIFDGQPPFAPRGCIAQAWTVAEVLRAWHFIHPSTNKHRTATHTPQ
ncbi:MAG: glycogen debranching protein [Nitrospirales bacterium]|nr:MAG: glycogen debranching protein [Nitrospirales bacterium]